MQVTSSSVASSSSCALHPRATAGTLLCHAQPVAHPRGLSAVQNGERLSINATQLAYAPSADATQPASSEYVPRLHAISRTLARELRQEQRLNKQLQTEIAQIQRQLQLVSGQGSLASQQSLGSSSSNSLADDAVEDPLFSLTTPPSVEQLQRRLVKLRSQLQAAGSGSLADVMTVTGKLQDMSASLDLALELVVPMVARYEPLLLQQSQDLVPRLELLSAALQLPQQTAAELLATSAPQLLATSLPKLQSNLVKLARILTSRGLNPADILQERPDLLCQSPGSIAAKLEELPVALGMSRQHVRQLVTECPQLLRRSVASLRHRYRSLCQLFSIPDSFVEEFVIQEPELLCMSADTVKAKFDSLVRRYGAFADDVVDMVLVDPAMLFNADPDTAPPAPTVKPSKKKQQRLQQQLLQQQGQSDMLPCLSTAAVVDASVLGNNSSSSSDSTSSTSFDSAASIENSIVADAAPAAAAAAVALEPWEIVLQQRQQQQRASRKQQYERKRQQKLQQQQEQLAPQLLDMQALEVAVRAQQQQYSAGRRSLVRQLLQFVAATGLSCKQAVELWQQEPALSQLPTAVVTAQVTRLSAVLGLDAVGLNMWQQSQPAADVDLHSVGFSSRTNWGTTSASASVSSHTSSSSNRRSAQVVVESAGDSSSAAKPILQVLVKEPRLLVLVSSQLEVNMQGLCQLLSLDSKQQLIPLLWEYPGLLLLAPEVAEYRLQHLAGLLQLSMPRTLALVLQQPQLLVERPVLLAARLGSLCTLLGISRTVASECVLREPLMLCVEDELLQQQWDKLCKRVGWVDDAVDLVLADPSALMRGEIGF